MASSFTTNKTLEKPGNGDYVDTWNVPVNADLDVIDQAFGGTTSINVTAASGVTTLSASQYRSLIIAFSGTLTANVDYRIPSGVGGQWIVTNAATGAFTVTVSSAGGGDSIVISSGGTRSIYSDGTNIKYSDIITVTVFDSGTVMLFAQTSAPTGWTKSTTHNNKALRVVSGAASSGGTVAFTSAFTSQAVVGAVGGTSLTEAQMPAHYHFESRAVNTGAPGKYGTGDSGVSDSFYWTVTSRSATTTSDKTSAAGSGASHTHTFTGTAIDLAVAYVDVILASKD